MNKIIQFGFSSLLWGVILIITPQLVVKVYDIAIIPLVCALFAVLGTMFPSFFAIGVSDFKRANIVERLMPIIFVILLSVGVSKIQQTLATAAFLSLIVGNTSSYLGYIIGCVLVKPKKKHA